MSEWQPIETAPRDGTLILLCETPHNWIGIGRHVDLPNDKLWLLENGWQVYATHWMPLPELPA